MLINCKKTKIIVFNTSTKYAFEPELSFPGGEQLEVVQQARLLGVQISNDLTWTNHVKDITTRAVKKLWVLIRFKNIGASTNQLVQVYQSRIRRTLENSAPVFSSGLTQEQIRSIEMVQKKAFVIILGHDYMSYENALSILNLERLDVRRESLCLSFANKCTQSAKHCAMFPPNPNLRPDSRHPKPFYEPLCNTARHFNSAIPALARLLNKSALNQ